MTSPPRMKRDRLLNGLAGLAVVQVGILAFSSGGPLYQGPSDRLAYEFGSVELVDETGAVSTLADGEPTLVLVFHSQCGYCRVVAPDWAEWLRTEGSDYRVVAVSREPFQSASAYATEHGWEVDVRVAKEGLITPRTNALTGRTPWVFALDGEGTVVSTAHGSQLGAVAAALDELDD